MITLKDRDPLLVDKKRLVENSSVFRYIIEECSQTGHDMDDFTPEIVESFLTLLEDGKLEKVAEQDFRELHKISVVFAVEWLIDSCRKWLIEKIKDVREAIEFDTMSFLFDECYYIHDKWNVADLMEALILELRFQDMSSFVSRYLRENYDHLNDRQCTFLLHLAGSNTTALLKPIIERIEGREYLDDRTVYLIQHIDLKLCLDKDVKLYNQMAVRFSEMTEISFDDCKLVFKLITAATKEATDRDEGNSANETVLRVQDFRIIPKLLDHNTLSDITRLITDNDISSMYDVVDSLVFTIYVKTFSTELREQFVEDLEKLRQSEALQKVSTQYVDMWVTALAFSTEDYKHQLVDILKRIRNNDKLSSNYDHIRLLGKEITPTSKLKNILGQKPKPERFVFKMKYPVMTDCEKADSCGFVIFRNNIGDKIELTREGTDYRDSGVHVHNEFRVEHMNWYRIMTGTTAAGETVRVPVRWGRWRRWGWRWRWWWGWFDASDWKVDGYHIDYNIEDYLVAKY